jgi:hypothetical protein
MTKEQKLTILRGLNIKARRLHILARDHSSADGWDTEQHGKEAARLIDEMIDMATVLRNELT